MGQQAPGQVNAFGREWRLGAAACRLSVSTFQVIGWVRSQVACSCPHKSALLQTSPRLAATQTRSDVDCSRLIFVLTTNLRFQAGSRPEQIRAQLPFPDEARQRVASHCMLHHCACPLGMHCRLATCFNMQV